MIFTKNALLGRTGLWSSISQTGKIPPEVLITGSSIDPRSNLIVALESKSSFSGNNELKNLEINYWRHLPLGRSYLQPLISIENTVGDNGEIELSEIWVQSSQVFSKARGDNSNDPAMRNKINRVLEAASRLNQHLRETASAKETAKILSDCCLDQVLGEDVVVRGLNADGEFDYSVAPYFLRAAQNENSSLRLASVTIDRLKSALGFRYNGLEAEKQHSGDRSVVAADPQSGVVYEAKSKWLENGDAYKFKLEIEATDEGNAGQSSDFLELNFEKESEDAFILRDSFFLGQKITDNQVQTKLLGLALHANRDMAQWRYPQFIDAIAEYDLLNYVQPFDKPPSLEKDGGEMLHMSLHGSGYEKKIENFGDQIGIAAVFIHRGLDNDGKISQCGVAVDCPFAAGNADSNFDGAIPDYLSFLPYTNTFLFTHKHYDHVGGVPFMAAKGLFKGKNFYCTPELKYFLKRSMDEMGVPARLRPFIHEIQGEGAAQIKDAEGHTRFWAQYCTNATNHSARCTPYVITGCYDDKFYNGKALVYGDAYSLSDKGYDFIRNSSAELSKLPGVDAGKIRDMPLTVTLNDVTAVRNDGKAYPELDVQANQLEVMSWFGDKGAIYNPLSTNDAEYRIGLRNANRLDRNITAVGANAEKAMSMMNLFGVDHEVNLDEFILDESKVPFKAKSEYLDYMADYYKNTDRRFGLGTPYPKNTTNVYEYLVNSLVENDGEVRFKNNLNGYLMWDAIMNGEETSVRHATRKSQAARDFRDDPSKQIIFVTGTQGNPQERFATIQKFVDGFSLLDANEKYRPTGYKIQASDFFYMNCQPAIVGNENYQEKMLDDLIRKRGIEVVSAFMGGFKLSNLDPNRQQRIVQRLNKLNWSYKVDTENNIHVYNHPIHVHGHGFREDLRKTVHSIPSRFHEAHHIPDRDSYQIFRNMLKQDGINHSGIQPDDFQVMRIDAHAHDDQEAFKKVGQLNPSYILINLVRKYGQFYRGSLEMVRTTLLRRDGGNRNDGFAATTTKDGVYSQTTARQDWDRVSAGRFSVDRRRKLGPGFAVRDFDTLPQSKPVYSVRPRKDAPTREAA